MSVSYDFNRLYSSSQIDIKSTWPKIETDCPFEKYISHAVCGLFINGRWNDLNRCAFLTVKYHNPENLVLQHLPVEEKVYTHMKTID